MGGGEWGKGVVLLHLELCPSIKAKEEIVDKTNPKSLLVFVKTE